MCRAGGNSSLSSTVRVNGAIAQESEAADAELRCAASPSASSSKRPHWRRRRKGMLDPFAEATPVGRERFCLAGIDEGGHALLR